ncbi:unnamed protein product [Urochloa decumbens]|uniref:F-box domain-containing protein n=1 Tax=Urochloa decumbens TaxID=240449 RepID=A0ABC8YEX9_9POAL
MGSALGRAGRATIVADGVELPADVLYEILLRVPAKPLCRLRLVCRSWRSLTSDPRFIRAHSSRHPLIAGLRCGCVQSEIHIVDMYSGSIDKRIRDHGTVGVLEPSLSTQGNMVCFSPARIGTDASQLQACVVDPATTGVTNILPIGIMRTGLSVWILGHVPSTGEHKVLRVSSAFATNPCSCEVITLVAGGSTQCWRARARPSNSVSLDFLHRAVVGGVVYFLLNEFIHDVPDVEHGCVVSFDLATEEWRPMTIRGPLSTNLVDAKLIYDLRIMECLQLAKLDGCLAMIHHHGDQQCYSIMDIWFLVEMNKGSWTKRYSIQYASDMVCDAFYHPYPLLVLDDGKVVVWFRNKQILRAYDPRIGTWEDMAMLENYRSAVSIYQGSLLGSCHQG